MASVTRCTVYVPGTPAYEQLEAAGKTSIGGGFEEVRVLRFLPLKINENAFRVLMRIQSSLVFENKGMHPISKYTYMLCEGDKIILDYASPDALDRAVQNIYKKTL
jgi:hypothetical protein